MLKRYKRSLKWTSLRSNVLFLGVSGGTPLIKIMQSKIAIMGCYLSTLARCSMKLGSLMFSQNNATRCFSPNMLDRDWWFVLIHDPRSKHFFEKNNVIMPRKEDNQDDDNGE